MTNPQPVPPVAGGRNVLSVILLGLAAGVLLAIGLVVVLVSVPAPRPTTASTGTSAGTPDATGPAAPAPGSQTSVACGQPCFTVDDAFSLAPEAASLAPLGADEISPAVEAGTMLEWEQDAADAYALGDGAPLACLFATMPAPIAPQTQSTYTSEDPILDLGTASSSAMSATHTARVTESVLWGARYPNAIRSVLDRCSDYRVTLDGEAREATVSSLELGISRAGVTDVAWTQSFGSTVVTSADLQRGNLIVRVEVTRQAGAVSDAAVEDYIDSVARALSELPAP